MFVPLYLRPSPFITIRIQPPIRVKLISVLSPQHLGRVDTNGGDADESAFSDEDAVDELAGCGTDGVGQWEGIVDIDLGKWEVKSRFRGSRES